MYQTYGIWQIQFCPVLLGTKIILNPSKYFGPGENLLDMSEKEKFKKLFWANQKTSQIK